MTTQFNYLDRDAVIAVEKNEAEISSLTSQIATAEARLSQSEVDFEELSKSSIEAIANKLAGKQ